jgi:CBS domain-containing protein
MKVRELMTTEPIAVSTDTPVRRVVELMAEHHVSGLPVVVVDGTVVGVVSECDLVARADVGAGRVRPAPRPGRPGSVAAQDALVAGELMSSPAFVVDEDDEVRTAAGLLSRHDVKRLPVTRAGKLCGILSRGDVLRVFLRSDDDIKTEIEQDVLRHKVLDTAHDVHVDVAGGVVTLRGTVARRSTADVIRFHTMRIDGVVKVIDHLLHGADDVTPQDDYDLMTVTMGFGPRGDRM